MAEVNDRIRVFASAAGTADFSIGTAQDGFQTPAQAGIASGTVRPYCAVQGASWEVGIGIITSGTPWSWSRSVVLNSSDGGNKISFIAGDIDVFCTIPAKYAAGPSIIRTASGAVSSGDIVVQNSNGTASKAGRGAPTSVGPFGLTNIDYTSIASCFDPDKKVAWFAFNAATKAYVVTAMIVNERIEFGLPKEFGVGAVTDISMCYDATNKRVVIAYADSGNSRYGMAVVCYKAGQNVWVSSPVAFTSVAVTYTQCCSVGSGKVVITYAESSVSKAVVGTVALYSISFGTAAVIASGVLVRAYGITYAPASGKVVLVAENASAPTGTYAYVGTVSGTSISFGTGVSLSSTACSRAGIAYDATDGKVCVVYHTTYTYAAIGTISGTSISFAAQLSVVNGGTHPCVIYDSATNRFVVFIRSGIDDRGGAYVLYRSGTTLAVEASISYEVDAASQYNTAVYDDYAKKAIICGNFPGGSAYIFSSKPSSATPDSLLGVALNTSADGAPVLVAVVGSEVEAFSGLTPGKRYFIAPDNTLTTSAIGTYLGKALSATKLLIGG